MASSKRPLSPNQKSGGASKRRSISSGDAAFGAAETDFFDDDLDDFLSQMPVSKSHSASVTSTSPSKAHSYALSYMTEASTSKQSQDTNRLKGELCMTREEKERYQAALQKMESELNCKLREKEMEIGNLKEQLEKEKIKYKAAEQFRDRDLKSMTLKYQNLQQCLDKQKTECSLTQLMNRMLDLSPDDGFVDWDDSTNLTLDDFDNDIDVSPQIANEMLKFTKFQ